MRWRKERQRRTGNALAPASVAASALKYFIAGSSRQIYGDSNSLIESGLHRIEDACAFPRQTTSDQVANFENGVAIKTELRQKTEDESVKFD